MSTICKRGHLHGTFRSACDCDACRRDNRKPFAKVIERIRAEAAACLEKPESRKDAEAAPQ